MSRSIKHISIFVARGDFYEVLGKENSPIFEIKNPIGGTSSFLFRILGADGNETCQYIGIFTGKLSKNISFLPGCEAISMGHFPVEIDKFPSLSVSDMREEILKMSDLCSQAEFLRNTSDTSLGLATREASEREVGVALANASLRFIKSDVRRMILHELEEWVFFLQEEISDYLITLAVNEMQTSKITEALIYNDHWLRENIGLHGFLAGFKTSQGGAGMVLYPRSGGMEEIVGGAAVYPVPPEIAGREGGKVANVLLSVWVCKELRLKGYGRKLVKKAANICRGPLLAFLPNDDEDETFEMLKFFRSCGCRNSVVSTSQYFGRNTVKHIGDSLHRILILDDMS